MSSPSPNTSSPSPIRINLNTSNHASRVSSASLASLASVSSLSTVKSIDYDAHQLRILDQLLLPAKKVWLFIRNTEDAYQAIRNMQVRGAPAIAIVGMLGLAIELNNMETEGLMTPDLVQRIEERLDYLILSRPTAVNLRNECQNAKKLIKECLEAELDTQETINRYIDFAETLLVDDVCSNVSLSEHGMSRFLQGVPIDEQINVLTICNTGGLATAAHGTALGVARSLNDAGRLKQLWFMETRPYLQGARLTALECKEDNIPATMICDNMIGWLMRTKDIHAVVVGCDNVASNGDTANKIGTYTTAIVAKEHNVPFYVAMPTSTYNPHIPDGSHIKIEERHSREVINVRTTEGHSVAITDADVQVWNPAFDITPAHLVTGGFITEHGVYSADELTVAHSKKWKTSDVPLNLSNTLSPNVSLSPATFGLLDSSSSATPSPTPPVDSGMHVL